MSIRAIAKDLYKATQKVSKLEKDLETAGLQEKESITAELRFARNELKMLQRIMEGEKENATFRKKFQGFGK